MRCVDCLYNLQTNCLTTSGFEYNASGNQTRAKRADGSFQRMTYDAANRLVEVRNDANTVVYESYRYGVGNGRVTSESSGVRTYYAGGGGQASIEYVEAVSGGSLVWSKTYIYAGGSLLATITPNGASEYVEYHHPDRLGTRLISNNQNTSVQEQENLPYGAALSIGSTRQFTSYDRSSSTGLDYAVNRTYDSAQGRFTQVDPIGMSASSVSDPQSLNLYAYCGNDPINHVDPSGLFWGKIGRFFKKAFKWIQVALTVAVAVLSIIYAPGLAAMTFKAVMGLIGSIASAASSVLGALGFTRASRVFGIIGAGAGFASSLFDASKALNWKTGLKAVADGATVTSQTLSAYGHQKVAQIFGLVAGVANFISGGLKEGIDPTTKSSTGKFTFDPSDWDIYKFTRSTAQQVANIAGATRVAGYLDAIGVIDDIGDFARTVNFFNNDKVVPEENLGRKAYRWGEEVADNDARDRINRQLRLRSRVNRIRSGIANINSIIMRGERAAAMAR